MKKIIIAIDGPAGCGKGTTAKGVAKILGYKYLDTGALYRAVALYFVRKNVTSDDLKEIVGDLPKIDVNFKVDANGSNITLLNGEDVEDEIRKDYISSQASNFAKIHEIREHVNTTQKVIGAQKGVVVEGRDIGTKVFPDAELKVFITADLKIRAERRLKELLERGEKITLEEVIENMKQRDYEDEHRTESPLLKADDVKLLDTSNLTIEQQTQKVIEWFELV